MFYLTENVKVPNGIMVAEHHVIDYDVGPHNHEYYEIEYILSGSGTYYINDVPYNIERGATFFITPSDFHNFYVSSTDKVEILNVMFSFSLCDSALLFDLLTSSDTKYTLFEKNGLVENLLFEACAACREGEDWYATQLVRCLLHKLVKVFPKNVEISSPIRNAVLYVHENFQKPITLDKVAKEVGLVPSYLSALFLKETGKNFKSYIDNLRFDFACRLLKYTDGKMVNISYSVGFTDYGNFVRRFKKKYGITPSEYRNKKTPQSD